MRADRAARAPSGGTAPAAAPAALADTAEVRPGCYAFRTPTALAPRLVDAGFTHLNLANNHANDYGPAGRASTERILDSLGLRRYGPLGRIAIDTVRRGDSVTTVGLIGFATYPFAYDLLDIARSAAVVDSIRPLVDLLVVTFHGGAEGVARAARAGDRRVAGTRAARRPAPLGPRGDRRRRRRGRGPRTPRAPRDRVLSGAARSPTRSGNFVTYRGFNLDGPLGVTGVLQLEFAPDRRLRSARLVPMIQRPRQGPAPDPDAPRSTWSAGSRPRISAPTRRAASREDGAVSPPP